MSNGTDQISWDAAPNATPAIAWDDEATQVKNRPTPTAPIPQPGVLKRPAMPGTASRYAGPQSVALGPEERASRNAPGDITKNPFQEIGTGAEELAGRAPGQTESQIRRGLHHVIEGTGKAIAPVALPIAAAAAPVATAISLGTGYLGQKAAQGTAELLGGDEDTQNLAGDVGAVAGGWAGAKIPEATAPIRQSIADKIVAPMVYENLGESKADMRMDVSPEKGITREGLVGTKKSLAGERSTDRSQIGDRVAELKTKADDILQNHPNANQVIDAEPMIDQAIDEAIAETEKVAGATDRLENLRVALKTKYGPIQGTPYEINNLKSEIQSAARGVGAYKNTQPVEASLASAMGRAASKIRASVDALVPQAAELNGRMSDLMDAQAGIRSKIAGERGQSLFGNFGRTPTSAILNRTLGSAPVRTAAARVINSGNVLDVPSPTYQGQVVGVGPNAGAAATAPNAGALPQAVTPGLPVGNPPITVPAPPAPRLNTAPQPSGPNAPPINTPFRNVPFRNNAGVTVLPSSGKPIIPSRPGVEIAGGPSELPAAAQPAELGSGMPAHALPEANPRNARGAIEVGPSPLPPEAQQLNQEPVEIGPPSETTPAKATRTREPREQLQNFDADTLEAAKQELITELGPPERRQPANQELRRKVSEMNPDEMRSELLTSKTTGLPNRRAFEEAGSSPAVGMSDADGLKAINDRFGYDAGNEFLKAKAKALRQAGLEAYHDKGDEFLYRGESPEDLQRKLERARDILKNDTVIEVEKPDGTVLRFKGADFSYGQGKDISEAETGLKAHKAEREARGETARGELRGIVKLGPQ